jgi:ABC-type nitrate/sulfonate/bicarbonate transport system permease component
VTNRVQALSARTSLNEAENLRGSTTGGVAGIRTRLLPLVGVLAALGLVELLSRSQAIPSRYFPPASSTISRLGHEALTESFWSTIKSTVEIWAIGLGLAVAIGIPVGLVLGSSARAYRTCRMLMEFLRPLPAVALIPLAVLLWGTALRMPVFLIVFAAVWPILIQTIYGVRSIEAMTLETARAYRVPALMRFSDIVLPGALPFIATGVRLASGVALVVAVTTGLVVGSPGLGQAMLIAQSSNATTLVYALILATGILGVALSSVLLQIERRALHWHPTHRTDGP